MHTLLKLLALACTVTYVYAAAAIYPYEPKPEKLFCQEGCYLKKFDIVIPYGGSHYPEGQCEVYNCRTNNEKHWYTCGAIAVAPGCRVVQDLSKKYPACCSTTVCDSTTEDSTTEVSNTEASTTEASSTEASTCENSATTD